MTRQQVTLLAFAGLVVAGCLSSKTSSLVRRPCFDGRASLEVPSDLVADEELARNQQNAPLIVLSSKLAKTTLVVCLLTESKKPVGPGKFKAPKAQLMKLIMDGIGKGNLGAFVAYDSGGVSEMINGRVCTTWFGRDDETDPALHVRMLMMPADEGMLIVAFGYPAADETTYSSIGKRILSSVRMPRRVDESLER